jgi:hypothetical protein
MLRRGLYITFCILTLAGNPLIVSAQQPPLYAVERLPFNTTTYSEMAPVKVGNEIVYCSDRRYSSILDRTGFDGTRLFNHYIVGQSDSSNWGNPSLLKSERSYLFQNGPVSVAANGKTVCFTSDVETGRAALKSTFKNKQGIFFGELNGAEIVSVTPYKYNSLNYNLLMPSISSDGRKLYFASDMKPGGLGRTDIYVSELVDGEWSAPVNLGAPVNTPGIETFPYIHPSGKLYFSSNRPGGLGRQDIYVTEFRDGVWLIPYLLPDPINSKSNDFAFFADEDRKTGYFTSERQRSDDIFSFRSGVIRKEKCDTIQWNSYCYTFWDKNAIKSDSIPFSYEWDFGDGEKAQGDTVDHCYSGPGTYICRQNAINLISNEVLYNQIVDTVLIEDIVQPVITSYDTVNPGEDIELSGADSNLPGWDITMFYWNFDNEQIAVGKDVTARYLNPGTYDVQLIVTAKPDQSGSVRETCVSKKIKVVRQQ